MKVVLKTDAFFLSGQKHNIKGKFLARCYKNFVR